MLEEDAQVVSDDATPGTARRPAAGRSQDEIIRINTEARPIALQMALLVPILAGLLGLLASFFMSRQPDIKPSADIEGLAMG